MIEPTAAASSATRAATTGGGTPVGGTPAPKGATSFAGELARLVNAPPASAKAERPDGEQTRKIAGHPYSRIENGSDKGLFVNQLAGSPREGLAFRRVQRDERVFHVYGAAEDKLVVEVKSQRRSDPTPVQPTGGATLAATRHSA